MAKAVAERLGLAYLDTGAMYRAVAFAAMRRGIDPDDAGAGRRSWPASIDLDVGDKVLVDGVDATIEIRSPEVTRAVSTVAANPEVRQRAGDPPAGVGRGARRRGGRGPGHRHAWCFPSAAVKVYLTADDPNGPAGAARRCSTSTTTRWPPTSPGGTTSTRPGTASPLSVADDAVRIDTTGRPIDDVVDEVLALVDAEACSDAVRGSEASSSPSPASLLAWYAVARGVVELVCRAYWRVEIRGRRHVPADGAYVIAPVHRSNIDTLLAGCLTRRRIRFMGKDSLWKYRWSGALFSSLGGLPGHRGTPGPRGAAHAARRPCEAGEPVVLFPEGTRQSGPTVQPAVRGGRLRGRPGRGADRAGRHRRQRVGHAQGQQADPAGQGGDGGRASRIAPRPSGQPAAGYRGGR